VTSDPALFFQIAAGLIPVLLLAGGLNGVVRPKRLLARLSKANRIMLVAIVTLGIGLAVAAEFVAISEAVAPSLLPSATRVAFVADVLAFATVLTAAAFLLPWLQGVGFKLEAWYSHPLLPALLIGSFVGIGFLSSAVYDSVGVRNTARGYCLQKAIVEMLVAQRDSARRASDDELALRKLELKIAVVSRKKPVDKIALRDLRYEKSAIESDLDLTNNLTTAVIPLVVPGKHTPEDAYATVGC
jgi:hypothetical protein